MVNKRRKTALFGALLVSFSLLSCQIPTDSSLSNVNSTPDTSIADSIDSNNSSDTVSSDNKDSSSYENGSASSSDEGTNSSSDKNSSSSFSEAGTGEDEQFKDYLNWSHKFDFKSDGLSEDGGSLTIDGLRIEYDAASFMGASGGRGFGGFQLGSKDKPQTTPWDMTIFLPKGTYVASYKLYATVASGGSATYEVSFGEHAIEGSIEYLGNINDYSIFKENDLEVAAEDFTLTMTANSKAIYLIQIDLELKNIYENGLDGVSGSDEPSTDPDEPDNPDPDEPDEPDPIPDPDPAGEIEPGKNNVPKIEYPLISVDDYYADVDLNLTGDSLLNELSDLISDMDNHGYDFAKYALMYTDESVDHPGYMYGANDGDLLEPKWDSGTTWNREHTWPQSRLPGSKGSGPKSDLHNLRASCSRSNSSHGNSFYGEGSGFEDANAEKNSLSGGNHRYEGNFRGDVARICFYMATRYAGQGTELSNKDSGSEYDFGSLKYLLEWNEEDPVDAFETRRNNRIYQYQGNRNPFIDYPELANQIWG